MRLAERQRGRNRDIRRHPYPFPIGAGDGIHRLSPGHIHHELVPERHWATGICATARDFAYHHAALECLQVVREFLSSGERTRGSERKYRLARPIAKLAKINGPEFFTAT